MARETRVQPEGHVEVFAERRELALRERARRPVARIGFFAEFRNVLLMVLNHESREFAVESPAGTRHAGRRVPAARFAHSCIAPAAG